MIEIASQPKVEVAMPRATLKVAPRIYSSCLNLFKHLKSLPDWTFFRWTHIFSMVWTFLLTYVNIFTILVTVQPFLLYWGPRSLVEKWYPEGSIKSSSSYFPGILWRANIKSSISPVSSTCFWQGTLFTTHSAEGLIKLALIKLDKWDKAYLKSYMADNSKITQGSIPK